jgi:hypothetical protein
MKSEKLEKKHFIYMYKELSEIYGVVKFSKGLSNE